MRPLATDIACCRRRCCRCASPALRPCRPPLTRTRPHRFLRRRSCCGAAAAPRTRAERPAAGGSGGPRGRISGAFRPPWAPHTWQSASGRRAACSRRPPTPPAPPTHVQSTAKAGRTRCARRTHTRAHATVGGRYRALPPPLLLLRLASVAPMPPAAHAGPPVPSPQVWELQRRRERAPTGRSGEAREGREGGLTAISGRRTRSWRPLRPRRRPWAWEVRARRAPRHRWLVGGSRASVVARLGTGVARGREIGPILS